MGDAYYTQKKILPHFSERISECHRSMTVDIACYANCMREQCTLNRKKKHINFISMHRILILSDLCSLHQTSSHQCNYY